MKMEIYVENLHIYKFYNSTVKAFCSTFLNFLEKIGRYFTDLVIEMFQKAASFTVFEYIFVLTNHRLT